MDIMIIMCYNMFMSESSKESEMGSGVEGGGVVPFHTPEQRIRDLLKENQQIRRRMHYLPTRSAVRNSALEQIDRNNAVIRALITTVSAPVRRALEG